MSMKTAKHARRSGRLGMMRFVGGAVALAMILGGTSIPAAAEPETNEQQPTTSQTSPSQTPNDATQDDAQNGSGNTDGSGSADGSDQPTTPPAGDGDTGSGDTGSTGGDEGTDAGTGDNTGDNAGGTGSDGDDSGTTGGDTVTVAAPTKLTFSGDAFTATLEDGENSNIYRLVNGDGWTLNVTAAAADNVVLNGWYSTDGTTSCTADSHEGKSCAELKDVAGVRGTDDQGKPTDEFTWNSDSLPDGVYSLAQLTVTAQTVNDDGGVAASSDTVALSDIRDESITSLDKLVVDTNASKQTTLTATTTPVEGAKKSATYVKSIDGFTVANPSPLFQLRTKILAAQPEGSKQQLLTYGNQPFCDASVAEEGKTADGKSVTYTVSCDATALQNADKKLADGSYTVTLNEVALGGLSETAKNGVTLIVDAVKPSSPAKLSLSVKDGDKVVTGTIDKVPTTMVTGDHTLVVTPKEDSAPAARITVTYPIDDADCTDSENAADTKLCKSVDLPKQEDGTFAWELKGGRKIDLTKIAVAVTDAAGLVSDSVKLSGIARDSGDHAFTANVLILDTANAATNKVSFAVVGDKKSSSENGTLYNTITGLKLTSKDPWFADRLALLSDKTVVMVTPKDADKTTTYAGSKFAKQEDGSYLLTLSPALSSGTFTFQLSTQYFDTVDPAGGKLEGYQTDTTAPTITSVTYAADSSTTTTLRDGVAAYVNAGDGGAAPRVAISASDEQDGSGIKSVVLSVRYATVGKNGELGDYAAKDITANWDGASGTYVAVLSDEGVYDLSTATVTVTDAAENVATADYVTAKADAKSKKAKTAAAQPTFDFDYTTLLVSTAGDLADVLAPRIVVDPVDDQFRTLNDITVQSDSPWFKTVVENLPTTAGSRTLIANGSVDNGTGTATAYKLYAEGDVTKTGDTFTLKLNKSEFSQLSDASSNGNHTITLVDTLGKTTATFRYDSTPAQVTAIAYSKGDGNDSPTDDGDKSGLITSGRNVERAIQFTVQDLLPSDGDATARTAGIAKVEVLDGNQDGTPTDITDTGADGVYTFTLADPNRTYDLSALRLQVTDNVGNVTTKSIQELAESLNNADLNGVAFITITDPEQDKNITTEILVNGAPYPKDHGNVQYVRNAPDVFSLKVTGNTQFMTRWRIVRQAIENGSITDTMLLSSTLTADGEPKAYGECALNIKVDPTPVKGEENAYIVSCTVPDKKQPLVGADNGDYVVRLITENITSNTALRDLFGYVDKDGDSVIASDDVKVGVDNQVPSFTSLSYSTNDSDLVKQKDGQPTTVLANDKRTLTFNVRDLLKTANTGNPGDDQANTSGVTSVTATVKVKDLTTEKVVDPNPVPIELTKDNNGICTINLSADGIYELSNISITATDNAKSISKDGELGEGANTVTLTLADIKKALSGAALDVPDTIAVSTKLGTAQTLVNGKAVGENQTYNTTIDSIAIKVKDDPAFKIRAEILAATYGDTNLFKNSMLTYAGTDSDDLSLTVGDAEFDTDKGTITWSGDKLNTLVKPLKQAKGQYNGDYRLDTTTADGAVTLLAKPAKVEFTLDTEAPQVTKISGPAGTDKQDMAEYTVDGTKYTVFAKAGKQQLIVYLKDLLPAEQRAGADEDNDQLRDESGTSGIVIDDVKLTIPAPTDLDGKVIGKETVLKGEKTGIGANGAITVTLDQEGFYDLSKITVSADDRAGNAMKPTAVNAKSVTKVDVNYDAIVADVNDDNAVSLTVSNVDGNPASTDADYYYRGKTTATYTVTDRWFALYQKFTKAHRNMTETSEVYTSPQDTNGGFLLLKPVSVTDGDWRKTGEYTWTLAKRNIVADGNSAEVEGKYHLTFAYTGLQIAAKSDSHDFVMDWTAPQLGDLVSSATAPQHWNWIFATSPVTVTLGGVNDPISGICVPSNSSSAANMDTHACDPSTNASMTLSGFDNRIADAAEHPAPKAVYTGTRAGGSISFAISGDSQRLDLAKTVISLTDAAGNPVDTGALNAYSKGRNNVKGIDGIAIDTVAPTLDVAYDNNDVRNGKYYKAHRTGTVTIVESNFDFVQNNDGDRVVVTTSVDGAKRTVPASAFRNPSGDRRTYVATFAADQDGDWTVDANFTDPGDHAAPAYHTEFTVDTVAPQLTLVFDNDNVRNGMYYNATRTATITEIERNFSEGESVITTTAKDDTGADQPAPGAGAWARSGAEKDYRWTNSVAFTGELHYTISAAATDLAGNVAQVVTSPEFVIDLTKPTITIDKVEDKTAYAGVVEPQINVDDTNIDQSNVTYTLTGDHRGEIKGKALTDAVAEALADNSKSIDFKDFERKADVDDVYTLTAKATDLAGNEFTTSKTFSVNRFGSTYLFDSGTESLRGAYVKKGENVTVTEINVSGLEDGQSRITVSANDKATQLGEGDYTTTHSDDKGWSRTIYRLPSKLFSQDGYYRVLMQSVDNAGNLSQNTMDQKDADRKSTAEVNFAVDSTSPTAGLFGVESGTVYYDQRGKTAAINAKDNMGVKKAELYVDGELVGDWNDAKLLQATQSYVLPADATRHKVEVKVTDNAGNVATASYDRIYVASNWWQYATHTPWIIYTSIFAAIIVIAAIAGALIAAYRRRQRYAYRDNPFEY